MHNATLQYLHEIKKKIYILQLGNIKLELLCQHLQ